MVYTLTLNPAIDLTIGLDFFKLGKTNKAQKQVENFGGKGINAAIIARRLHYEASTLGFIGNVNQEAFNNYLIGENIIPNFISVQGKVRTNIKIKSFINEQETELNCLGFEVKEVDEVKLFKKLKQLLTINDILLICGSVASGCSKKIIYKVAKFCNENNIMFALDSTREHLLEALEFKPLVIKPNLAELNELFNTNYSFKQISEIINLAQKLIDAGAINVLISNGKYGSILVNKQVKFLATSPSGKLENSVGSGDAMFTAFTLSLWKNQTIIEALKLAAAAGAANAFQQDLATEKAILELKQKVIITNLNN